VHSRGALIERLSQSIDVFAPVAEDEYSESKVGLARPFQGKGLAKVLVEHCLGQGTATGYSKFRADIQTENEPALRCSRVTGFDIFLRGPVSRRNTQVSFVKIGTKGQVGFGNNELKVPGSELNVAPRIE
jgi:GNAT superfamily N-acetyltransferase